MTLAACIGLGADYHSAQAAVFAIFESNIDVCLMRLVSVAHTLALVLALNSDTPKLEQMHMLLRSKV